jgi:hypothetical protein
MRRQSGVRFLKITTGVVQKADMHGEKFDGGF